MQRFSPHCSLHYSCSCGMMNSFKEAHDSACSRDRMPVTVSLPVDFTIATDLPKCLDQVQMYPSASQLLLGLGSCTGKKAVLRNVTCEISQQPPSSSCSASCFLWFERNGSTFILFKDIAPANLEELTRHFARWTCDGSQPVTHSASGCCDTSDREFTCTVSLPAKQLCFTNCLLVYSANWGQVDMDMYMNT